MRNKSCVQLSESTKTNNHLSLIQAQEIEVRILQIYKKDYIFIRGIYGSPLTYASVQDRTLHATGCSDNCHEPIKCHVDWIEVFN